MRSWNTAVTEYFSEMTLNLVWTEIAMTTKESLLGRPLEVGSEHTRGVMMTVNAEADIEQGQLVIVNPIVTTAWPDTNGTRTVGDGLILARAKERIRQGESGTVETLTERLSN